MPASDEFKKALRSGDLPEAFVMAMGKATELNITTKVIKADGTVDEEYNSAQSLETRLDILNGTIENRVGEEFVGTGKYTELQAFHQQQVALGNRKIQENFQSLQELFRLLVTLQQYNRLTNAEQPLDLTFLEVPSQKLPPERVITTLQEQASILESLQEEETATAEASVGEKVAEKIETSEPATSSPENIVAPPPSDVTETPTAQAEQKTQTSEIPSSLPQESEAPTNDRNLLQDAAIATGFVASTVAAAKSVTSEPKQKKTEDGESLDFLDSFAALDLDDAPEPLMPVSEVEIDDWETPTEMSPAERLSQTPTDTYIPTLSDFDHDDAAGLDDLLDDDLGDLLEADEPLVVEDESPVEPEPAETVDELLADSEDEAIAPSEPEALEISEPIEESDDFDAGELPDFSDDNLDALLADSFSEEESPTETESSGIDDADGFNSEELPDFSDDNLDALLADSEADSPAIASSNEDDASIVGFDDFADITEDDFPDDVMDDLLHEPEESGDDGEITAISFGPKSTFPGMSEADEIEAASLDEEPVVEPEEKLDNGLLEDKGAIAPEAEMSLSEVADLTDVSTAQDDSALEVGEITEPQDATIPSEAIADEPEEIVDNELLVAASAMTSEATEQLLQETLERPEISVTEDIVPEIGDESATSTETSDISTIDDSELLSFIDEDWQFHPDVIEITSLDAETDDEPILLQPLSEEELATLEEVEDTDWLSSTVDDDWEPLNLSDDETQGLESFSLSLDDEELAVDSEMASMETGDGLEPVISEGVDAWSSIGEGIGNDDVGSGFEAAGGLPEIDLALDDLGFLETDETGDANAESLETSEAIADDVAAEVPDDSVAEISLETDDLSSVTENINALELAGAEVDLELDSDDISEVNTDLDISMPSEMPLAMDAETSLEDTDEPSDIAGDLDMEVEMADDTAVDNDDGMLAGMDASALSDLSDDELDSLELDDEALPESLDVMSSDIDQQNLDPFATANLDSTDLDALTTEADLDFEVMDEDVDLDLSIGSIGKLASPDPLVLDDNALDELDIDADLDTGIGDVTDELAMPVFDTEPDPFADLNLGDTELEATNLDDLDLPDTADLPDALDDSSLDELEFNAEVSVTADDLTDELATPEFDIEPDPFADLALGDDEIETTGLDNLDLPDLDNLASESEAADDGINDDLNFDDLNLDIDGLDNLDFDNAAINLDVDDAGLGQDEPDVSNELGTDIESNADEDVALAMDAGELDQEILASLAELDQATQNLETDSLDFSSQALLDDLGDDPRAEPKDDGLEGESGAFFADDDDGNSDFNFDALSLDDLGGLDDEGTAEQSGVLPDMANFAGLDLELGETDALPDLPEDEAIAAEDTEASGVVSADDDWADFDLNFDADDPLADLSTDESNELDDAPIDLDFDLGDLNLPDVEMAETSDSEATATDNDLDWQQFSIDENEASTASDDAGWDVLGDSLATPVPSTAEATESDEDDWAVAGLDGLDDLSDNDLSELGDIDLDALELDDDKNDDKDFDLFGDDESGNVNPFLDPSV